MQNLNTVSVELPKWFNNHLILITVNIISEKIKRECIKYTSNVDVVSILKLEFQRILKNTDILNKMIDDIQPYGSRISGIYTDDSDVDINISYSK